MARLGALVLCLVVLVVAVARAALGGDAADSPSKGASPPRGRSAGTLSAKATAATADAVAVAAGTAPGTCLAFAPLSGDRHKTVFLDPGHGGIDVGTAGTTSAGSTIDEKGQTLAVGLDLLAILRGEGYRVVMSRIDDRLLIHPTTGAQSGGVLSLTEEHEDTEARIVCANAAHADVLVSIHFNAFGDPAVNGAETFYDAARPFSAANRRLAGLVQRAILAQLHALGWAVPDRGVTKDSVAGIPALSAKAAAYPHLLELGPAAAGWLAHPSTMPGILVEPLFLTHPAEADVAVSKAGRQAIARGIADALNTFFTPTGHFSAHS
jgi:N-acetylmuramoyl-L-alanine amidase